MNTCGMMNVYTAPKWSIRQVSLVFHTTKVLVLKSYMLTGPSRYIVVCIYGPCDNNLGTEGMVFTLTEKVKLDM